MRTVICPSCGESNDVEGAVVGRCAWCRAMLARKPSPAPSPSVKSLRPEPAAPPVGAALSPVSAAQAPMSAAPPRVENDNPYAAPLADTDAAEPVTARWTDLRMQPEEGELEDPRRLPLAPRMVRLGGALIDWVFAVIFGVVAIMFFGGRSGEAQDLRAVAWVGIGMALVIQSVLIARRGQSLGKMSLGMKIVNYDTDEDADPGRTVLVRTWLPLLLNLIPFFKLIDILFIFNAEHRCLHDILAGTRVVDIRGEYVRT